ncbi:MAG: hypothetical protein CYG59_22120 [Chloroflexi bacterium]|nr:MAG: hypothetical protein CYG59_22120 [Chloroflexota bacterium]
MNQLVQEVLARVRNALVLPLQRTRALLRFLLPLVRRATRRCSTRSFFSVCLHLGDNTGGKGEVLPTSRTQACVHP